MKRWAKIGNRQTDVGSVKNEETQPLQTYVFSSGERLGEREWHNLVNMTVLTKELRFRCIPLVDHKLPNGSARYSRRSPDNYQKIISEYSLSADQGRYSLMCS